MRTRAQTDPPAGDAQADRAGFAVYVHWPFCLSKCPYCDFNSHVRETVDQAVWRDALLKELEFHAAETGARRVDSVFFGGGTPSLMPVATVAAVIEKIDALWGYELAPEITLEANPTSVEADRFAGFRAAGVNRLSLGVQALRDRDLKFLGRGHDVAQACAALDLAAENFDRFSFDLIYARPDQSARAWEAELREALSLAGDHLSLYQLTIEPGTGFEGAVARGVFTPADADHAATLYEMTQEICADAGLAGYEISNHARPGGQSRHNLVYWRYGDYAGIGPGAHGRLSVDGQRIATANLRKPERWLSSVRESGVGREARNLLSAEEQASEMLIMGLRLAEGISLPRYAALAGVPLPEDRMMPLSIEGLLWRRGDRIGITARGQLLLDAILRDLTAAF